MGNGTHQCRENGKNNNKTDNINNRAGRTSTNSNFKPDAISIIPWSRTQPLAWDVSLPSPKISHVTNTFEFAKYKMFLAFPIAASWSSTILRCPSAVATTVETKLQNTKTSKLTFRSNQSHRRHSARLKSLCNASSRSWVQSGLR